MEDQEELNKIISDLNEHEQEDRSQLEEPIPLEVQEKITSGAATIDKYVILEELGKGGHGVVYKAYDIVLGRYTALKILKEININDRKLFEREARLVAKLDHPNITPVYEVKEDKGMLFISMKFVDGQPLNQLIGELSLDEIMRIMVKVCDAVAFAHYKGVIHRDIKPHNILVDKNMNAYLVDFGIAKSVAIQKSFTREIIGTPEYMAPEMLTGRNITTRSDIYSLGATIYNCATGECPFNGNTDAEIITNILNTTPIQPSRLNPDVPSTLETIIDRCLNKVQELRYHTVEQVKEDLERYMRNEPLTEHKSFFLYQLLYKLRKNKKYLAIITLTLVAASFAAPFIFNYAINRGLEEGTEYAVSKRTDAMSYFDDGTIILNTMRKTLLTSDKFQEIGYEAIERFSRAIEIDTTFAQAYLNRARINFLLRNDREALKDIDIALNIMPTLTEAYLLRISTHFFVAKTIFEEQDLDIEYEEINDKTLDIEADIQQLVNLNAQGSKISYSRAILECMLGNFDLTERHINEAIQEFPSMHRAYYIRGFARAKMASREVETGQKKTLLENALSDVETMLKSEEGFIPAYNLAIHLSMRTGNYDNTIHHIQRLKNVGRRNISLFTQELLAYEATNNKEGLRTLLTELTETHMVDSLEGNNPKKSYMVHFYKGWIELALNNNKKADEEFETSLRIAEQNFGEEAANKLHNTINALKSKYTASK